MSGRMAPLLGKKGSTQSSRRQQALCITEAVLGIIAVGVGFWHLVHYLQDHAATNPLYIGAYPFIGVASIAAVLPFFLALSFSSEFARLHPLRPSDYCYLGSRLLRALQSNTLKVTAKEL